MAEKASSASPRASRATLARGPEPALLQQFVEFAETTRKFSREIGRSEEPVFRANPSEAAQRNLEIVRTIFSKWNPEILAILYGMKRLGFEELRRILGSVSAPVLSRKLRFLHQQGLVQRTVLSTPMIRVQYALTDRGLMVAQLGEPVLLYLRVTDGVYTPRESFVRQPTSEAGEPVDRTR